MQRAIMIGAGNIGRGFIGALLAKSGYQVLFADVNQSIIDAINEKSNILYISRTQSAAIFLSKMSEELVQQEKHCRKQFAIAI